MDKFWMVLVDGTENCKFRHPTFESAEAEAERLLNLPMNYGKGVFILEMVRYGKANLPVKWEAPNLPELPF